MTMSFTFPPQAVKDNEMSLVEGEVIEQIKEVIEEWWCRVGQGGAKTKLFPGAYSRLANMECLGHHIGCSKLCGTYQDARSTRGTKRGGSTTTTTTTASCACRSMSLGLSH